jgi:hypothetical protein
VDKEVGRLVDYDVVIGILDDGKVGVVLDIPRVQAGRRLALRFPFVYSSARTV